MGKKKITLRETAPKKETSEVVLEEVAAAAVKAPGLEEFKTPDVSQPAKVTDVSETAAERFADENVDWNQALDDADNEVDAGVEEIEATLTTPTVTKADDEAIKEELEVEEISTEEIEVASSAEEPVVEENDFQPAAEIDPPVQMTQGELDKDYTEKREAAVTQVMERYQLTEEERDQVLVSPEEFLPRMAAQVYVDVYESVLGAVSQMLPERVNNINAEYAEGQKKTERFFTEWPALKTEKGLQEVTRIGSVYRQLNQDASSEDFIKNVGIQASLSLGLKLPGIVEESTPAEEVPAFQPAGSGSVSETVPVVKDPRKSNNQFERLNATWDD